MLSTMIFASDAETQSRIQRRCTSLGGMNVYRSPEYRPSAPDIVRMINSYSPELALIEFRNSSDLIQVEEMVHACCPHVAILGFASEWKHDRVIQSTGACVRILPTNGTLEEFKDAILEAMKLAQSDVDNNVIAFVPAKAGSGASTTALM